MSQRSNKLANAAKTILDYLNDSDCGCTHWTDTKGKSHTCDMGYVFDFLGKVLEVEPYEPSESKTKAD